jgi:lipoprotein-anchoring transpeptidase ErfK/SrfK
MTKTLPAMVLIASLGFMLSGSYPAAAQSFWGSSWDANSVSDRQVVAFPKTYSGGQIIVSFGDRRLYHVTRTGQAISYPIAVPRPQSRWQGVERISMKRVDPPWSPTPRMLRENPKLPRHVRGGDPKNPLGVRAIYLGNTLYRIHGTDAPWTIGKNVSKGCVRMHNAHVVELYKHAKIGMKVTSTWKKFKTSSVAITSTSSRNFNPFRVN